MKSNHGIVEEIERLGAYLKPEEHFCPNDKPDPETGEICSNHAGAVPVGTPKAYRNFGTNASGSKRVQCAKSKKTFVTETKPAKGQHDTHQNRDIFSHLVNKLTCNWTASRFSANLEERRKIGSPSPFAMRAIRAISSNGMAN